MLLILENSNEIKKWLFSNHRIDVEQDFKDVQDFKNQVFSSTLYKDAKRHLSQSTVRKYRKFITSCGNNQKKRIKSAVLSFGRAVKRKQEIK